MNECDVGTISRKKCKIPTFSGCRVQSYILKMCFTLTIITPLRKVCGSFSNSVLHCTNMLVTLCTGHSRINITRITPLVDFFSRVTGYDITGSHFHLPKFRLFSGNFLGLIFFTIFFNYLSISCLFVRTSLNIANSFHNLQAITLSLA